MKLPKHWRNANWWKSYAIYLVIVIPLVVIGLVFIPGWPRWLAYTSIVLIGLWLIEWTQRKMNSPRTRNRV